MANNNNIPSEVIRIQNEYGFNYSELVGKTKDGDVYAISLMEEDGSIAPTGLPVFVIKGDSTEVVSGSAALKLSSELFRDE